MCDLYLYVFLLYDFKIYESMEQIDRIKKQLLHFSKQLKL